LGGFNCIFKRGKGQVKKKTWESTPGIKVPWPIYTTTLSAFAYNFHEEEPNYNFNAQFPKKLLNPWGLVQPPFILGIVKALHNTHFIRV
jgi:hypothetical protein